jgi:hypothetical protein
VQPSWLEDTVAALEVAALEVAALDAGQGLEAGRLALGAVSAGRAAALALDAAWAGGADGVGVLAWA